ncbi:MAG: uroporphyrinogen decarboxylase family protein [Planctomycetota bacterium]|nr:uroporphyrinogen decarboxylase family protein [Planctomycetota bacterium]
MTSKERVLTAFACQEPDRVPINYFANAGIERRLEEHFGLAPNDSEGLLQALSVDFRGAGVCYCGPKLHEDIPERGVKVDDWGIHRRWVEHETGGYWDYCDFPLRNASEDEVAEWSMPSPDDFDYSGVPDYCKRNSKYALYVGGAGRADIINKGGMLRGTEQSLVDLISEDPAGLLLTKRHTNVQIEILRRTLEAGEGAVDFLWMGEDLGTQIGPLISLDLYRKEIRPIHQRFVDLAKSFDIPVMIHSCGSSSWAYEDFIEMGISVVDALQPEAKNMEPEYLKKTFGGRLAFHGCISTAGPVARGTVEHTVAYCKRMLDIMMPGGGYCFAPTHQLQDNSPTENVVAMYETAKQYGTY